MRNRVAVIFVLWILLVSQVLAQDRTKLDALNEKIRRDFEMTIPEWKHERVEPIVKTENVLIEFWSFANRKVKISILPHESAEKAHEVFKNHERYSPNKQVLNGLGDEAVASGYGSADVAFRRGKFTVYISATADVDADADARSLSQAERFKREKSEMVRVSREFARHMVRVLDAPER
jgi:HrpA-like RNA helicase